MAIPIASKITVADFETYVGTQEAIELSEPDDVNATAVNATRVQFHIDRAFEQIDAYDTVACPSGKAFLRRQVAWLQLSITRYLLDTLRRREDVTAEYKEAKTMLDASNSSDVCSQFVTDEELEELGIQLLQSRVTAAPRIYKYSQQKSRNFRRGSVS